MKTILGMLFGAVLVIAGVFTGSLFHAAPAPGSITGPDSYATYQSVNGVTIFFNRVKMSVGTTTPCTIKSPTATSTLDLASGASFTTSTTTASVVTFNKSTAPATTGTSLGVGNLAANAKGTILASTTISSTLVDPTKVFAPNTYFVMSMTGGTGTYSPVGFCQANFILL